MLSLPEIELKLRVSRDYLEYVEQEKKTGDQTPEHYRQEEIYGKRILGYWLYRHRKFFKL